MIAPSGINSVFLETCWMSHTSSGQTEENVAEQRCLHQLKELEMVPILASECVLALASYPLSFSFLPADLLLPSDFSAAY